MERYPVPSRAFESIRMRLVSDEHVEGLLQALDGTRTLWKVLQGAGSHRALAAAWVVNSAGGLDYCDAPLGADGVTPEVEIVVGTETSESAARRSSADRAPPSSPSAPHRGGAAAATLRREITERFERLAGLSYYELLGLTADASLAAIKGAYHKAAKRYHPDALVRSGVDAEARARASRVFVEIGKAHAVLADPGQRREYDASLAGDADLDGNQLIQAETLYRKGEILLRQGNFAGAIEYLEPAVQLWPEEAEYQSALGWSLYKKLPPDAAKARTHLEKAVTLAPNDGVVHFRLGLVLRALGQHDDAAAALARAKRLDPNLR